MEELSGDSENANNQLCQQRGFYAPILPFAGPLCHFLALHLVQYWFGHCCCHIALSIYFLYLN